MKYPRIGETPYPMIGTGNVPHAGAIVIMATYTANASERVCRRRAQARTNGTGSRRRVTVANSAHAGPLALTTLTIPSTYRTGCNGSLRTIETIAHAINATITATLVPGPNLTSRMKMRTHAAAKLVACAASGCRASRIPVATAIAIAARRVGAVATQAIITGATIAAACSPRLP